MMAGVTGNIVALVFAALVAGNVGDWRGIDRQRGIAVRLKLSQTRSMRQINPLDEVPGFAGYSRNRLVGPVLLLSRGTVGADESIIHHPANLRFNHA